MCFLFQHKRDQLWAKSCLAPACLLELAKYDILVFIISDGEVFGQEMGMYY